MLLRGLRGARAGDRNIQASGYDRKRLTSVGAAEAGIDYMSTTPEGPGLEPVDGSGVGGRDAGHLPERGDLRHVRRLLRSLGRHGRMRRRSAGQEDVDMPGSATVFSNTDRPSAAKVRSVGMCSDGTKRLMRVSSRSGP